MNCVHCGAPIRDFIGHWGHKIGEGSYLNRCSSNIVPYGHEAHPADVSCPTWCLGAYEKPECAHKVEA